MSTEAVVTCLEGIPDRLFCKPYKGGETHRTLSVDWIGHTLKFMLLPDCLEAGSLKLREGSKSINDLLQNISRALYSLSFGLAQGAYSQGEEKESALQSLRGQGAALFRRLVPGELQKEIQSWPDGTIFQVSTNAQWVPWELMHDGKGFLGQRMLLVRVPRINLELSKARRELTERPSSLVHGQKILNVVGGGLNSQKDECRGLFCDFGSEVDVSILHERPLSALSQAICDADLVHFTCHGHRDPLRLQIYKTDDITLNLLVDSVAEDEFRIKPRCLVYASACSSAASEIVFEEFLSFAWQFYAKGAAAYIGTLGAVPTRDAISFSRRFYSRLASGETANIYRAYQATRKEAFLEGPACLLFCIYGNYNDEPSFKVAQQNTGSGAGS